MKPYRLQSVVVAVASGFLAAASCGGEGAPSVREQATRVAEALCSSAFTCDCDNDSTDLYSGEPECATGVADTIVDRANDDTGLTYNAECAEVVASALGLFGCELEDVATTDPRLFRAASTLRQCRLFVGTLDADEPCRRLDGGLGDDCNIATYCDPVSATCVAFGDGELEASCATDDECETGLRCLVSEESGERVCLALPSAGEPCSRSRDCAPGAYCRSSGACLPLPEAGEGCSPVPSIEGRVCAPGTACAANVCVAGSAEGQACGVTCGVGLACESGICRFLDAAVCGFVFDAL